MVFNLNGIDLEYEIIIERRKSITLYMIDGKLIIKSYRKLNDDEIKNMISRHQRFISKRLKKEELNPNIIHLLGKEYKLETEISNYNNLIILDELNIIKIYTKKNNESYIKNIIYNYYKGVLEDIINKYESKIKSDNNINFIVNYEYKYVKTYFGECFPKRRLIILNLKLAKYELKYILSVIYHEYAHFYYQNHQNEFYNYLEKRFNNYKEINKELRKIKYNDLY